MNEWVEWKGGKCPVDIEAKVDVKYRDGGKAANVTAGIITACWRRNEDGTDHGSDIVAYRVAKPLSCEEAYDDTTRGIVDDMPTSALNVQVDGNHYKQFEIQPVTYINANKLDFLAGNVVKYISRHKLKGKQKDVEKAIHFCKLILELQYGEGN